MGLRYSSLGRSARRRAYERPVSVDGFFGVDGLVSHGGVDVAVAQDELGDVRRHPVDDGLGGEDPAEIVRGEVQWFAVGAGEPGAGECTVDQVADARDGDGPVFSRAIIRWNSSGIGGFQVHLCAS